MLLGYVRPGTRPRRAVPSSPGRSPKTRNGLPARGTSQHLPPSIEILNFGLDGDLTAGILERFQKQVLPKAPHCLTLCGGANDLGCDLGVEPALENLTRIVQMAKERDMAVVVGGVPPIEACFMGPQPTDPREEPEATRQRREIHTALEELVRRNGGSQARLFYADLFTPLSTAQGSLDPGYSSDGLHLDAQGYRIMGEIFLPLVKTALTPYL